MGKKRKFKKPETSPYTSPGRLSELYASEYAECSSLVVRRHEMGIGTEELRKAMSRRAGQLDAESEEDKVKAKAIRDVLKSKELWK